MEKVESVATYAANNIKQSFAEVAQTETEAAQNVQKMGGKMQALKSIAEQLKTAFSGIREKNCAWFWGGEVQRRYAGPHRWHESGKAHHEADGERRKGFLILRHTRGRLRNWRKHRSRCEIIKNL